MIDPVYNWRMLRDEIESIGSNSPTEYYLQQIALALTVIAESQEYQGELVARQLEHIDAEEEELEEEESI